MNILPINKIILASVAFILTHWKKILEISIIPVLISLPFLSLLPDLFTLLGEVLSSGGAENLSLPLPDFFSLYFLLFFYGYLSLSINLYRLVMFGAGSVRMIPLLKFNQIVRFMGLSLFVGLATTLPTLLTGVVFLQLIASFLIIPLTLNFINIALNQTSNYRVKLPLPVQINLFFLQVILPAMVGMIFSILISASGAPIAIEWAVKILVFYWTLVNLALCYQRINPKNPNISG